MTGLAAGTRLPHVFTTLGRNRVERVKAGVEPEPPGPTLPLVKRLMR